MAFINETVDADTFILTEIFVGITGIQGINADTKFLPVTAGMRNSLVPYE
jgi:hypothetical protein